MRFDPAMYKSSFTVYTTEKKMFYFANCSEIPCLGTQCYQGKFESNNTIMWLLRTESVQINKGDSKTGSGPTK